MSRAVRISAALVVLVGAAVLGFLATASLGPERLEEQVLLWLEKTTGRPAVVGSLRLRLGLPVQLEGRDLRLWDGALTAERASARIDVFSLLIGRPRLTRLRLDGAHLQIERLPEGTWQPPIFRSRDESDAELALEPLRIIEGTLRLLLARPFLADTLVVRRSRISVLHPALDGSSKPVRLDLQSVNGRLLHSRLFGDARLFLRLRVASEGQERGVLEWNGTRASDARIDVTMAATGLDLAVLAPYLRGFRRGAHLRGRVDGVAEFSTPQRGVHTLGLDLAARGFSAGEAGERPLEVDTLSLRMGVGLSEDRVSLEGARISAAGLDFVVDAGIDRPLSEDSLATVRLALAELSVDPESARSLAGWLPRTGRERFLSLAERVRSGRLVQSELRGRATLGRWRAALAGRLAHLPEGFVLSAGLDDVAIQVDEANRLEHLSGRLSFEEDTLEIERASADLNGGPLPSLNLSFQGLSKVLASPAERRELTSGARALVGVTPLWDLLRPEPGAPRSPPPRIELYLDHLTHPALLWPLRDVAVELQLEPDSDGVRMQVRECHWAGVMLDGAVDWTLAPERRIDVRLVASEARTASPALEQLAEDVDPPSDAAEELALEHAWASGRVEVGPVSGPSWQHEGLRARFRAVGGEIRLGEVDIDLAPQGALVGRIDLDLGHPDRVPYVAQLAILDGDASALVKLFGADPEVVTGRVALGARRAGSLGPGRPLLHDTNGRLGLSARDGTLRRTVPPMLALALASGTFNPFATLERLRYERVESTLLVAQGRLSTDALELDGPDLRLFASGSVDMSERPYALDVEVVLFLFRQLDRALELIPLLNVLLLGENQNLVAAYFDLMGTWDEPIASAKPLRTIEEGPTEVLTRSIPGIVTRGMKALGGLLWTPSPEASAPADPVADADPPSARSAQ